MTPEKPARPEFSRPIAAAAVDARPHARQLEASAGERAALASRFDLVALDLLKADLSLQLDQARSAIRVRGSFEAEVVQTCVVTLEPVPARLVETVDLLYSLGHQDAPGDAGARVEVGVEVGTDEESEPIGPEGLDLGEALAQLLSVALDPYPRARDADLSALEWSEPDGEAPMGPFSVLTQLRRDD